MDMVYLECLQNVVLLVYNQHIFGNTFFQRYDTTRACEWRVWKTEPGQSRVMDTFFPQARAYLASVENVMFFRPRSSAAM